MSGSGSLPGFFPTAPARSESLSVVALHLVGHRIPVDLRVVDDGIGDRLRHDPLHHLHDGALLGESVFRIGVVGLDLVAKVPVRQAGAASAETGESRSNPRRGASRCCIRRCTDRPRPYALAVASLTAAGIRFENRSASRASAHSRRVQASPFCSRSSRDVSGKLRRIAKASLLANRSSLTWAPAS